MQQPPGQYSPDGRWWWDGQRWVAVQQAAARPAATSNRNLLLIVGAVVLVGVLGICGMGVCAAGLLSQGSAGIGSPSGDITGTYALKQIDGHNLPAGGSFQHFVFDGSMELHGDGTYTLRFSWQGETGEMRYTGDDGPYTRSGNTVMFSPKDESYQYTGQLGNNSVLITYDWNRNGTTDQFLFSR